MVVVARGSAGKDKGCGVNEDWVRMATARQGQDDRCNVNEDGTRMVVAREAWVKTKDAGMKVRW